LKQRSRRILIGVILVLLPLWALGDPPLYSAKEIHGQIVDEETGQPLEGVVVVAEWKLYSQGIGHGGHSGTINTIEVLSDKEGKYFIPAWGPRPRPPFAYLDHLDPELKIFKSDYYPKDLSNEVLGSANRNRSMVRSSDWDGKVIKLQRFRGDWMDYADKIDFVWAPGGGHCLRTCPLLVLALDAEDKRIKAMAPKKPVIPTIVNIDNLQQGDREFLRRIQNEQTKK
jgi:hypothetical protein